MVGVIVGADGLWTNRRLLGSVAPGVLVAERLQILPLRVGAFGTVDEWRVGWD